MTVQLPPVRSIPPKAERPEGARLDNRGLTQPRREQIAPTASPASRRWALLDQLRKVTGRKSHRMCARYTIDGDAEVGRRAATKTKVCKKTGRRTQEPDGHRASVSNVIMCGSALCPVCNARKRAGQLEALASSTEHVEGSVLLLTFTVPHDKKTPLADMLDAMSKAWNSSMSARQKRAWEGLGMVGWVRSLDYTYGKNGHHPHYHAILYFSEQVDREAWELVWYDTRHRWSNSIERSLGRRPDNKGQHAQQAEDRDAVRKYALKAMAMDALWSESKDLGGDTMWQVLASTIQGPEKRRVWDEIETATYRRRWVTAGGCVSLTMPEPDDDTDDETDDDTEAVLLVPRDLWGWLVVGGLVPRLLSDVERGDPVRLDRWRALLVAARSTDLSSTDRALWRRWLPSHCRLAK